MSAGIAIDTTIGGRSVLASGQVVHREEDGPLEIFLLGARVEFAYENGSPTAVQWDKLAEDQLRVTFVSDYQDYGCSYDIPDMFRYGGQPVSGAFYVNWAGQPGKRTRQISYTLYL